MRLADLSSLAVLLVLAAGCGSSDDDEGPGETPGYTKDDVLRLNQLQAKATHNSYHVAKPNTVAPLDYTHQPLGVQVSAQGVRAFELDTRFIPETDDFEVFHIVSVDDLSTCRKFVACLAALRDWSKKNPAHHTLVVQIEPKEPPPADAEPYFGKLEAEILSVWPRESIVTPDDVQGAVATLREAIVTNGWPTLGATRGKILFYVDNASEWRTAYTKADKDLSGRLMFVNSSPGKDYEATYVLNDPVGQATQIADALASNFFVRTRADGDNVEPLAGDTTKRDAAFATGAQLVSTDYPAKVEGVDYVVNVPGGTPSRCNPVTAPVDCTSKDIEHPGLIE